MLKGGPFKNRTPRKEEDGPKLTETQKVEATENSVNSKISALDHKKNPQVGCTCKYCGKHWKKSHGPKFLKVPRYVCLFSYFLGKGCLFTYSLNNNDLARWLPHCFDKLFSVERWDTVDFTN